MQSALGSAAQPLTEWDLTDHPRETQRLVHSFATYCVALLFGLRFLHLQKGLIVSDGQVANR